jgi:hypothetical protein
MLTGVSVYPTEINCKSAPSGEMDREDKMSGRSCVHVVFPPCPYSSSSERVLALPMRTKGAALGTATNWIFNFMVVEITPVSIALCRVVSVRMNHLLMC